MATVGSFRPISDKQLLAKKPHQSLKKGFTRKKKQFLPSQSVRPIKSTDDWCDFFGEKQDKIPAQSLHRDVRHLLIGLSVPDRSFKEGGRSRSGKYEVGSFQLFFPLF